MNQFTYVYIDILKNDITFTLSYSERAFQWREIFLTGLENYVEQSNIIIYGDYRINDHYFCQDCPFKRSINMRVIGESLFQREDK